MGFDSVVFADSARIAALSCFRRLKMERDSGRKSLILVLNDSGGAEVIEDQGLGSVRRFDDVEIEAGAVKTGSAWRERFALVVRRMGADHVMAPLGLLGAPQAVDYFKTLRSALSIDKSRDLLFFEERPHCLVPEAVPLQLASKGVRLPPASQLRSPRRYGPFVLRLTSGLGVPPIFGGLAERSKLARGLKQAFREASDWDPQRALGPKLQPVVESWTEQDSIDLFALAAQLGVETSLGSRSAFKRRMARLAASAGSRLPIERYWLSLPTRPESDSY